MTITKTGKCERCKTPVKETRVFAEAVNMFEPDVPKGTITREISVEIRAWRKRPMRCEIHPKQKERRL